MEDLCNSMKFFVADSSKRQKAVKAQAEELARRVKKRKREVAEELAEKVKKLVAAASR